MFNKLWHFRGGMTAILIAAFWLTSIPAAAQDGGHPASKMPQFIEH